MKNFEKQINQKGMNYTLFKACRQIKTNLYVRAGISKKPELLQMNKTFSNLKKKQEISDKTISDRSKNYA